jgi:hypothetical protein
MSLASLRAATDKQTCHIYIQDLVADTENTLASQVRLCDTYYRQTCPLICGDLRCCLYLSVISCIDIPKMGHTTNFDLLVDKFQMPNKTCTFCKSLWVWIKCNCRSLERLTIFNEGYQILSLLQKIKFWTLPKQKTISVCFLMLYNFLGYITSLLNGHTCPPISWRIFLLQTAAIFRRNSNL